jgi:hypothetical protein
VKWAREAINNGATGLASSRRLGFLIATSALAASVLILSISFLFGHDTSVALAAVSAPLAGMNGYAFVKGKPVDGKDRIEP